MGGITSGASLAAQAGPTQFVTTDAAGNLAASSFGPATISSLFNDIHDVRQEARAGVGLAMATGNIRYDDRPGKFSVGVGGGGFIDEFGGALGVGYTSESQRVRVNLSGGATGRGDVGVGAGISFTLN